MYLGPQRKSNRLKGYDYSSSGFYFVTICVKNRRELLGEVRHGIMELNECGCVLYDCWNDLPNHYNCRLDYFVVMPNHVHTIIEIIENDFDARFVGTGFKPVPTKRYGLSEIIRGLKTFSSRKINEKQNHFQFRWQRSFYDHIIRNEKELNNIRKYIMNNPLKWDLDRNNQENLLM